MLINPILPSDEQIERTARMLCFIGQREQTEANVEIYEPEAREFWMFFLNKDQILGGAKRTRFRRRRKRRSAASFDLMVQIGRP